MIEQRLHTHIKGVNGCEPPVDLGAAGPAIPVERGAPVVPPLPENSSNRALCCRFIAGAENSDNPRLDESDVLDRAVGDAVALHYEPAPTDAPRCIGMYGAPCTTQVWDWLVSCLALYGRLLVAFCGGALPFILWHDSSVAGVYQYRTTRGTARQLPGPGGPPPGPSPISHHGRSTPNWPLDHDFSPTHGRENQKYFTSRAYGAVEVWSSWSNPCRSSIYRCLAWPQGGPGLTQSGPGSETFRDNHPRSTR